MDCDRLEWLWRSSLVLMVGRDVGRLHWGLNGVWMGSPGMGALERVGGFVVLAVACSDAPVRSCGRDFWVWMWLGGMLNRL